MHGLRNIICLTVDVHPIITDIEGTFSTVHLPCYSQTHLSFRPLYHLYDLFRAIVYDLGNKAHRVRDIGLAESSCVLHGVSTTIYCIRAKYVL